jgi:hypothetical protein
VALELAHVPARRGRGEGRDSDQEEREGRGTARRVLEHAAMLLVAQRARRIDGQRRAGAAARRSTMWVPA